MVKRESSLVKINICFVKFAWFFVLMTHGLGGSMPFDGFSHRVNNTRGGWIMRLFPTQISCQTAYHELKRVPDLDLSSGFEDISPRLDYRYSLRRRCRQLHRRIEIRGCFLSPQYAGRFNIQRITSMACHLWLAGVEVPFLLFFFECRDRLEPSFASGWNMLPFSQGYVHRL